MKCNKCSAEWFISKEMSVSINNCPFCGFTIKPDLPKQIQSLSDALTAIICQGNIEVLRDSSKLMSYFCDIAPNMSREKTMLSYLLKCNGNNILLDAFSQSHAEQIVSRETLSHKLATNCLISLDLAHDICDSFWVAIGGEPMNSPDPKKNARIPSDTKHHTETVNVEHIDFKSEKPNSVSTIKTSISSQVTTVPGKVAAITTSTIKKYTPDELFQQAIQYEKGFGAPKKSQLAFKLYQEAAQQGHVNSMFSLAEMYAAGSGIPKDPNEAFRWYLTAAQKGHSSAMLQVGLCYKEGRGVHSNASEATKWIRLAAFRGNYKAQLMTPELGKTFHEPEPPAAKASDHEKNAKAGNPDAQFLYARCYALGVGGVSRNYQIAADYYEKAAEQGHAEAQLEIAKMYENGLGVMISLSKAEKYYTEAACSNNEAVSQKAKEALKSFIGSEPKAQTKSLLDKIKGLWVHGK